MIEVRALGKAYGPRVALREVSFSVQKGEIVGFLGPNGAGKTTTMRILTGYLPATSGDARVAGFDVFDDPMEVKRRVGYLPETPPLYPELSIGAYLAFCAELRGVKNRARVGQVMEMVGLKGWEKRVSGSLSKGYRQRVGLAQALLHDPPVLILDEPTSGLDPVQVGGMRDLIQGLAGSHTVILSTHILSEVESLCPRVIVIDGGQLVADGPIAEVRARAPGGAWTYVEVAGIDGPALGSLPGITHVEPLGPRGAGPGEGGPREDGAPDDGFAAWKVHAPADPREMLHQRAARDGFRLRALERRLPTLEEAFLGLVGKDR